jgi:predicted O-methyltransferase YrrM
MSAIGRIVRYLADTRLIAIQRERLALRRVKRLPCSAERLSNAIDEQRLKVAFSSPEMAGEWNGIEQSIAALGITDKAGGVNPGDRRAIYYLLRALRPRTVLEVGTHIGASTVHAAAALRANQSEDPSHPYRMTTVDVKDVNDPGLKVWSRHGSTFSPKELVTRIGAAEHVKFVTARALEYLSACEDRYDFVFLDGDHAATAVYQEIVAALRILNDGGVVLLHDYFPRLRPLWTDNSVIPGPWLGVQRLMAEGAKMIVLPLGALPWETKLGSHVTSLALAVGGK